MLLRISLQTICMVSLLEIIIKNNNEKEFDLIVKEISKNNLYDYRINVYLIYRLFKIQ